MFWHLDHLDRALQRLQLYFQVGVNTEKYFIVFHQLLYIDENIRQALSDFS
jgi:hypothetical protein